jgi:hypothetical protein
MKPIKKNVKILPVGLFKFHKEVFVPDKVEGNETDEEIEIGVDGESGISKISTTLEGPLVELYPPPKNILFVDEVDASQ